MLTQAQKTIYATIDTLAEETGDRVYLSVHRGVFDSALQFVAEVRSGDLRGKNFPLFTTDGELCLHVVAPTEEQALAQLATLCKVF